MVFDSKVNTKKLSGSDYVRLLPLREHRLLPWLFW